MDYIFCIDIGYIFRGDETFMFVIEKFRFVGERTNPVKWTQCFTTALMSKLH
jgi:hypothetical protein